MMTQPKGVAMVIHNDWGNKTTKGSSERPTTDRKKDVGKVLGALFMQFGYYVIHRLNLTSSEIRQHMVGLSDQYHGYQGNHNSLLVAIISQANSKGQIVDHKGDTVSVNEMLQHFVHSRCPALIERPKIFLLLLKVTVKNQVLQDYDDAKTCLSKRQNLSSVEAEEPVYFDPESMSVEEDCLVVRVMYEDENIFTDNPTFGGIGNGPDDDIPWFAAIFIKLLADQAGTKDFLTIVKNMKREFQDHISTARSIATATTSSTGSFMVSKLPKDSGHVNVFVDESLKKKLYMMPGL